MKSIIFSLVVIILFYVDVVLKLFQGSTRLCISPAWYSGKILLLISQAKWLSHLALWTAWTDKQHCLCKRDLAGYIFHKKEIIIMRLSHLLGRAKFSVWLYAWCFHALLPQHPGAAASSPGVRPRVHSPWQLPVSAGSPSSGCCGGAEVGAAVRCFTLQKFFSSSSA